MTGGRSLRVKNRMYGFDVFSHVTRSISTVQKARNLRSCVEGPFCKYQYAHLEEMDGEDG